MLRTPAPLNGALDVRSKSIVAVCSSNSSDWNSYVAPRAMCFAICFIGAELQCRERIVSEGVSIKFGALRRNARVCEYGRRALWLIEVQATTARLNKNGQWRSVRSQVSGTPESRRSVVVEKPYDLVVGLERSYKSQEEV